MSIFAKQLIDLELVSGLNNFGAFSRLKTE
jgi:hypothetical protein